MSDPARSLREAQQAPRLPSRREWLRRVIFETDTPAGKAFDVALLGLILLSIVLVMIESVEGLRQRHATWIDAAEWGITALFTVEYLVRLACVPFPVRYARSFFGVIDLLAILPSYLSLVVPGSESLLTIRALRLLRLFRVFKLVRYLGEANVLVMALRSSLPKVVVFMGTVLVLVMIMGSTMYLLEGPDTGFTSIPRSVYWAIVTMTTVGYGDITPESVPGQIVAAFAMLLGYSIIAVPTGIVSAELVQAQARALPLNTRVCSGCFSEGHALSARFCRDCGAELHPPEPGTPAPPGI